MAQNTEKRHVHASQIGMPPNRYYCAPQILCVQNQFVLLFSLFFCLLGGSDEYRGCPALFNRFCTSL